MAEFLTMEDAESKFGKKGRTNAGLTLGIIGTALAALGNNGGGCGCGNNGILGGLFGGNNGSCCAMQQAEQAKTLAMVQGQQADNLSWANRVQSMQDDIEVYSYSNLCAPVPSIAPLYCSPFTQYGTGMYAGTAASNWNAVNTAINGACPTCQAQ